MEKLFRHIGFVRLDSASVWEVFYWLTPEFIVLPTVLAVYFICRFLTQKRIIEEENVSLHQETNSQQKRTEDKTTKVRLSKVVRLLLSLNILFKILCFYHEISTWRQINVSHTSHVLLSIYLPIYKST